MAQLLEEHLLVSDVSSDVALFSRFWVAKSFREVQLKSSRVRFQEVWVCQDGTIHPDN